VLLVTIKGLLMALTRRQFLTLMGGSAGAAVFFQACGVPEKELFIDSPIEMPEDLVTGLDNWYATTFKEGMSSQGIIVRIMEGRAKKVEGNTDHPLNRGTHSSSAESMLQLLYHPDRIDAPLLRTGQRGSGEYKEISWEEAIDRLSSQFTSLEQSGEQDKAVLVTDPVNGHLGMVVKKFVSATGIRHMTYEVLEHTTLIKAMDEVFGQDNIPDFDIDNASLVLSFGADFLSTWVSPTRYSRGYGEFRQGHEHRGKLIHIDSRFSTTAANADEWVYVNPGTEGVLALSIMKSIVDSGQVSQDVIEALFDGNSSLLDLYKPELIASFVGVSESKIKEIGDLFVKSEHPIALGGGTAGAYTNGLQNLKAIYSLNHLKGNVGHKGGLVFTPNSPIEGLETTNTNSASEFKSLIDNISTGEIKLLLLKDADLYYGLPDSFGFKEALFDIPFIVSFSNMKDDTASIADLILPQNTLFEDWGTDVPLAGPGYQSVAFQQPVVRPFFESRGDNLGTKSFPDVLMTLSQVLNKNLDLSGDTFLDVLKDGARQLFDLKRGTIQASSFQEFWMTLLARGVWCDVNEKSINNSYVGKVETVPEAKFEGDGRFNLVPFASAAFYDGRYAFAPWMQAMPDPISTATWQTWIEINHKIADELNIKEGDVIEVRSSNGGVITALAMPNPATPPNILGIPVGQGHRDGGRYAAGRGSNVLSILGTNFDDKTGALAWASNKVNITPTGEWIRVPKFENSVPDFPRDEHQQIVEISTGNNNHVGH